MLRNIPSARTRYLLAFGTPHEELRTKLIRNSSTARMKTILSFNLRNRETDVELAQTVEE
jgi:hypothetical protein